MMDDHGDDDDDATGYDVLNFLISENSSNGKFPNVLEKANEIFIKLLNGSRRDENFIFLLSFIKQHDMYNDVEHLALERIIWQLKSLLMDDIQAKQFVKTFSQYYSWMRTSGHSNQNQIKQLINSTLLISKALFSTFQLLSKLSKYHTIKAFMEYLQEGFLTTKNLSDICQSLYKNMDSEDLELLKNLQKAFRNTLLFISENPQFIVDQICILSQCIDTSPGMLIVSLFEGINLFNNQFKNMENSWTDFGDFDCTSFILTSKQLFDILINFTIINTKDGGFVCNSTVECTQQPMKKLMLNLNQPHPYSTVETLFSNNTRFQDLKIRDILKNASVLASKLQSSANISEETTNTILRMELSKLKNFHNVMSSVVAGNCDEDILGLLLEFTTKEETSITVKEICNMPPAKVYQIIVNFIQNMNFQNLVYKVSSPHELETILRIFSKYITYVVKHFEKFQHTFDNLLASSKVLKKIPIIARFQQVIRAAQPKESILLYLHSLASSICKEGPSFFSDTNIFIDKLKVSNLVDEDMKKYNIPEDSPPFCLQLYQEILQSPNGAIAWTFLKPLLHGKILYTPDVPEVRQIIHKANHTFSFLENLKGYSEAWLAMSIIFKNSDQLLKKTQLQTVLLNSFIRNYLESQLNLNLGDLVKKLQVYEYTIGKMLNSSFVKQINYVSQFMVNISSCFSFDRFLPINTSEALEKKAKSMIQTNNFLAGIIFNISSSRKEKYRQYSRNKLPPHVQYTIRTNALYSMKTDLIKNPIWRSHPRRLPGKGFTYSHVFAPIQDMIDRAIISVQTGSEIFEPEVQVQAMPFPCHTRDHFLSHIGFFFPLIMMLAWIISVASMVRKLVFEKEIHLEEVMRNILEITKVM
ncbi:ATP-binding cassette sub-family A member 13-like [Mixophyes fleayi]|uniref:ATP-binding cassette sub-family A member 13-like n=1 Tax=Mixophyes fleayi TaxID=3061075 RepID=UPI003F4D761C